MYQIIFFPVYVLLVVFFSGLPSPPTALTVQLAILSHDCISTLYNPAALLMYLGPTLLIIVTYFRGKKINNHYLFLFPILAYFTSFIPLIFVFLFGPNGPIFHFLKNSLFVIEAIIPIGIHILCIVMSFKHFKVPALDTITELS
jgi:hypothetical protein